MPNNIPILNTDELDKHHFGDAEWKPAFASFHHLFQFNRLEDMKDKIKFPIPPHRKTLYDFIFLTGGTSARSKGLNMYHFGADTFFFLPPYQISTHEFLSEDATGFFCHFDPIIFEAAFMPKVFDSFQFMNFLGEPIVEINPESKAFIINILKRLELEYQKKDIEKFDIVAAYLFTLFTEVKQLIKPLNQSRKNAALRITENYKNALSQHIYQKQRVTDYANMLAISPDHLNKSVKISTGKSAQDLLSEMIMLEAKVLLRQTDLHIGEVAFKLSSKNPSDFSRFFKSKMGITPKEFKKLTDIA